MSRDRFAREIHRRRGLTIFVIGSFLTGLPLNSSAAPNAPNQRVSVVAINCVSDGAEIPTLSISGGSYPRAKTEPAPQELSTGVHRFDITLPPGSYGLRLNTPYHKSIAKTYGCAGLATFTVLSGHDRHLVVPMEKGLTIDDADCSIAGAVPAEGLAIGLVRASGGEVPAVIDSGAYYFENLKPRRYVIRVRFSSGIHADFPVDLSDPHAPRGVLCSGTNAMHNRFHNVSMSSLVQLAGASTYSFSENSAAQLTGGQLKALIAAYRDIIESKTAAHIPIEHFQANVSRSRENYDVTFLTKRHDGTFTGGGIFEVIDPTNYRVKTRQSYCPGRSVSSTLPPC